MAISYIDIYNTSGYNYSSVIILYYYIILTIIINNIVGSVNQFDSMSKFITLISRRPKKRIPKLRKCSVTEVNQT